MKGRDKETETQKNVLNHELTLQILATAGPWPRLEFKSGLLCSWQWSTCLNYLLLWMKHLYRRKAGIRTLSQEPNPSHFWYGMVVSSWESYPHVWMLSKNHFFYLFIFHLHSSTERDSSMLISCLRLTHCISHFLCLQSSIGSVEDSILLRLWMARTQACWLIDFARAELLCSKLFAHSCIPRAKQHL